jgi:hypothetical protein
MSDNTILSAMRRMGIEKDQMSGHGFRAMARTILDEVLGFRPDFIGISGCRLTPDLLLASPAPPLSSLEWQLHALPTTLDDSIPGSQPNPPLD